MKIVLKSHSITIEEIQSDNIPENLEDYEFEIIDLIRSWYSEKDYMEFKTSGSTGKPKVVRLTKHQMRYSAASTMNHIDPKSNITHSIVCISPSFIGGAMLVIRSLIHHLDILVQKPNAIPTIEGGIRPLISVVPYQVMSSLDLEESIFDNVHSMLIGGAGLPEKYVKILRRRNIHAYLTYGMTETASHIALRPIQSPSPQYFIIGDTEIATDSRDCLKLRGTVTEDQWVQTNDMIKIKDSGSFEWIGRADLIINSGGFKINPEPIESFLSDTLKKQVLILPEDDDLLGQKVILLIESEDNIPINDSIFESLHPYSRPKKMKIVKSFIYTHTGKVDRFATAKKYVR